MAIADTCVQRTLEGIIRGTNFTITTGLDQDAGVGLVQQFQLQFQRKLTRIYDLASPSFYYIEGPSEGTLSLTKVVGPKGMPKISCSCDAQDITLNTGQMLCQVQGGGGADAPLGGGTSAEVGYVLKNAIPFGLQGSGDSNNFLIVFSISYMFNDIQ